jgi:hypothetical protein
MWKKHPLTRFLFGTSLALLFSLGLLLSGIIGSEYWADGSARPIILEGTVANKSLRAYPRNNGGTFDLSTENPPLLYTRLEVHYDIFRQLKNGQQLQITTSPGGFHIYAIKIEGVGEYVQDEWQEGALYQDYQAPVFWTLIGIATVTLVGFIYGILGLLDWLLPPRHKRGIIVARMEQGDYNSADYGMLLRVWPAVDSQRNQRFELNQSDFFKSDGADFAEVSYTPFFRFVRQVKPLNRSDFPPGQLPELELEATRKLRLRYLPNWRNKIMLFSDGLIALFLYLCVLFCLVNSVPGWFESNNNFAGFTAERYLLPGAAIFLFCLGLLFTINFMRKLRDLKAPKRVTVGPVLSKWRVNGGTNDSRRQIVVADGGLQGGSESVRKFDISSYLFDELQVGDVVEIEHTPRLRYILRLEVKGHQELLREA